jgi:hypothetical protein
MAVDERAAEEPSDAEAGALDPAVRPARSPPQAGPAWERLVEQLDWYERKAKHHKRWFQALKVVQIVVAAAIPVAAAAGASATVAGALGALIVVVEGVQQLFQFQQNWIAYRGTAEALKHEKFLYLAAAGPYEDARRPAARLAERVERLVSQEQTAWATAQRDSGAGTGDRPPAQDGA